MHPLSTPGFTLRFVLWLLTGLAFFNPAASAQHIEPDPREEVFTVVEHSPEFPGGFRALQTYLARNVKYPDYAAKAGIAGQVYVSFIVEQNGQLTNVQLLKTLGFGCDEEALRVVRDMPRWTPGTQSGRAVRVKHNLPILFGPK